MGFICSAPPFKPGTGTNGCPQTISRFARDINPNRGRSPPGIWSRHRPPRRQFVVNSRRVRGCVPHFRCEAQWRYRRGWMAVREHRAKPFVHDFEIVVLPFLPTFVDPEWSKKGSIEGRGGRRKKEIGVVTYSGPEETDTKGSSPGHAEVHHSALNTSPQASRPSYITRSGTP